MPTLLFSNFDFLPIYKAHSAGSQTYPFKSYLVIIEHKDDFWRIKQTFSYKMRENL